MLDKLQIVRQRFDEVSDLIIQPDIIKDQKRYVQINKEYADLSKVMKKGEEYKVLLNTVIEAKEILKESADAEMIEMAKMELEDAEAKIPILEDTIKMMLIPKDLRIAKM